MRLIDLLNSFNNYNKKEDEEQKRKQQEELEKEMDVYGLDEDEKELVRKDEADIWNFEYDVDDEDKEDDDYYSEDV